MALPASSTFTGSNGASLGSNWTAGLSTTQIRGNAATGANSSDDWDAYWNADSFAADQYSKATIMAVSNGAHYAGVIARASGASGTFKCYQCVTDGASGSGHTEIAKVTNGSFTSLKAVATTFTAGDIIEIRCSGTTTTTIAMYKNGALVDSVTDSSTPHTSGAAGIVGFHRDLTVGTVDDWEGGNLSSVAVLSSATPSGTLGTTTTATIGATTDQTSGTFYAVVDTAGNISGITASQIKAGQNNGSVSAVAAASSAVSTSSPAAGVTGLTAATGYSYAVVQNTTAGDSNVLTGTFTTASAATNPGARSFGPKGFVSTLLTM